MTRGTDANLAFVFTTAARPADPHPGARPAPELDRYERLRRGRAGYLPDETSPASPERAGQREPIAVLADILSRDGAELSASAIRQRNIANADHLAALHATWTAETTTARHDRYRDLVTAALPPGHRQPLSHQARWLYRDHPLGQNPPARRRARHRTRGWRLTTADHATVDAELTGSAPSARESVPSGLLHGLTCEAGIRESP